MLVTFCSAVGAQSRNERHSKNHLQYLNSISLKTGLLSIISLPLHVFHSDSRSSAPSVYAANGGTTVRDSEYAFGEVERAAVYWDRQSIMAYTSCL